MDQSYYILDPQGDIELVLRSPNAVRFEWLADEEPGANGTQVIDERLVVEEPILAKTRCKKCRKRRRMCEKCRPGQPFPASSEAPPPPPPPLIEEPAPAPEVIELEPEPESLIYEPGPELEIPVEPESNGYSFHEVAEPEAASAQASQEDHGGFTPVNPAPAPADEDMNEVRFRLSSKHLHLSSLYFRNILEGSWKESIVDSHQPREVSATEWDVEALLIVMNIIHSRHRKVPRSISLELFCKVAMLVDYYQCHEVTEVFVDHWIEGLRAQVPDTYGKECVLWLFGAWVFSRDDIFRSMTELVMKKCPGPPQTMDLAIPEPLLTILESRRAEAMSQVFDILDRLRENLESEDTCSFECSAMLLGSLTKQMRTRGLDAGQRPTRPFHGYSFDWLKRKTEDFYTPTWGNAHELNWSGRHTCDLQTTINPSVDVIMRSLRGITLEECGPRSEWNRRKPSFIFTG